MELLYSRPGDFKKHSAVSLLKEREAFLLHMLKLGTPKVNVQNAALYLRRAVIALKLTKLRPIKLEEIDNAIERIWGRKLQEAPAFAGARSAYAFRAIVKKWLRFHNCLQVERKNNRPLPMRLREYRAHLISRRMSDCAVDSLIRYAHTFVKWLNEDGTRLSKVSLRDIDRHLLAKRGDGWAPATVVSSASAIRSFLSYTEQCGWSKWELHLGIRQLAGSRRVVSQTEARKWREVRLLISSLKGSRGHAGTRASAAIQLMATYALRTSELARLRVSDFDFQKKTLALRRSKNGQLQRYPLTKNAATAVRQYLRSRPRQFDQLFLNLRPPYAPALPKTFYHITHYRFAKLGIKTGRRGPHAIRHARAMELLRNRTPLRQIGDFLGHKHPMSPLTYAKFTIETLRRVANLSLGSLV